MKCPYCHKESEDEPLQSFEEWLNCRYDDDYTIAIAEALKKLEELKKKYNVTNSNT